MHGLRRGEIHMLRVMLRLSSADQILNMNAASDMFEWGQVKTGGVTDAAITSAKLADGAATGAKLGSDVVTLSGTQTISNKTLLTPTIASFTNATHNHQTASGGGTISHNSATDNPSSSTHGVTGSVVGTTDTQILTNKTLTSPTINDGTVNLDGGTLIVPTAVTPAQTAEGSVVWDSDGDLLTVGTGSTRKTMVDTDTSQTLSNKTLLTPTIASFTNATHDHQAASGGGTLSHNSATDNPASGTHGISGSVVGTTDIQTLTNKTLTSPTINDGTTNLDGGTLIVPTAVTPAQTADGSVVWDSDGDVLTVGTGSGRKTMVDTDTSQTLTNKTLTSPTINSGTFGTAATFSFLTAGSVLFAGTGGALSQDNSNLFWDNTKKLLLIGDTANAKSTIGLTINQAANDDEILAFKSSDVAHLMTDLAEADTFGTAAKQSATDGGLRITGYSETVVGLVLVGRSTTEDTTKTATSQGYNMLLAQLRSGANIGNPSTEANIFVVRNNGTTRFILDADGDSHQDIGTAWTNFDDQDDIALLHQLAAHVTRQDDPIRAGFGRWLASNRDTLQAMKLVTFNDDGHHFVNMSRLTMLLVGSIRQIGTRLDAMQQQLALFEDRLARLT